MQVLLILLILFSGSLFANPCMEASKCKREFFIKNNFLRYYSNYSLATINPQIKKAIIVVHGTLRDGDNYFNNLIKVAADNGNVSNTLIIAPSFKRVDDEKEEKELYWGRRWYQKWKYGYRSQDSDKISSFEVIDRLIRELKSKGIKEVIITGHSAGGQFTQRYAVGTKIDKEINIQFAPSNPSSYMFLHEKRYQFVNANFSEVKEQNCSEYNHYIYGPIDRARYLDRLSIEELRVNFAKKSVTYLMGEEDHDTDYLDRSCEANLQGIDRFDRAQNFFYYVKKHFENHKHVFLSIPNVGHDSFKIYNSIEGRSFLFGKKKNLSKNILYKKIGNDSDFKTTSESHFLLLGGGSNEAAGFKSFLKAANGGDIIVLTGKHYLNHRYTHDLWKMADEFKIDIDSVETIALLNTHAASEEFVLNKIRSAEAIFFTGGDQFRYIERIKGSPLQKLLNQKIQDGVALGGTSAGLAIMGEFIFSAEFGGLRSRTALRDPHAKYLSIESDFLDISFLKGIITDTHFNERDREGRLLSFMYRAQADFKLIEIKGLGIDEKTSLSLFSDGSLIARGEGMVSFYKASGYQLSPANERLTFKKIQKVILKNEKTYRSFADVESANSNSLSVIDGKIQY